MRNKISLIVFCLFFIFVSSVLGEISGKIIVRGKWGNGPGEFGLDTSEPPGAGPSIFTVSPNGDIYIADVVNKRIVAYDHNGNLLSNYSADEWINTIDVDGDGYIYYTHDEGLKILDKDGKVITVSNYHGKVRLDRDKIYLISDYTSYELQLNKETNELKVVRTIDGTANGRFIISNGIDFRCSPDSLSETGIAYININGKPIKIKKKIKGEEETVKDVPSYPWKNLSDFSIIDGEKGNAYLENWGCVVRINSDGILTGIFTPTLDDQRLIDNMPYSPSGWVRVKNGKIYFMGFTDEEFMIIEYEFQPVK